MRRLAVVLLLFVGTAQAADSPMIFNHPAISARNIAFGYAGDLWVVDRTGGEARRLTSGVGLETHPVFSPDGTQVAFAGEYDGNLDVYVVPVAGGEPRRLTYHPGSRASTAISLPKPIRREQSLTNASTAAVRWPIISWIRCISPCAII